MIRTPSIRTVPFSDIEFVALLARALRMSKSETGRPMAEVAELLAAARRGSMRLGPAVVYEVGGNPYAVVAGIQSAGAAALYLLSTVSPDAQASDCRHCLELARQSAADHGCKLHEVLLDPEDSRERRWHEPLRRAGFCFLTRLVYLTRRISSIQPLPIDQPKEHWISFCPGSEPLFLRCLEESYIETLDCPELTGIRTTAEVLAGHRAAGEFDPAFWKLAMREGQAVGVLLLNRLRGGDSTEITYLGVAQTHRRTGVASALVRMAEALSREASANQMALAVDARNAPARRLYARCGFEEVQFRDVWIATCAQVTTESDVGNS